jgi:hypothetical protein
MSFAKDKATSAAISITPIEVTSRLAHVVVWCVLWRGSGCEQLISCSLHEHLG